MLEGDRIGRSRHAVQCRAQTRKRSRAPGRHGNHGRPTVTVTEEAQASVSSFPPARASKPRLRLAPEAAPRTLRLRSSAAQDCGMRGSKPNATTFC